MPTPPDQGTLFTAAQLDDAGGTTTINARCTLRTQSGVCVVLVAGVPLAHFAATDRMAEAYAMVTLVEQGFADQKDVARAFGRSTRSVRRFQRRFELGGLSALGRGPGYPKGRARLRATRSRLVHDLRARGVSLRAIAARIGVTEKAVRKLLHRMGWKTAPRTEQIELPLGAAAGADLNVSAPTTPAPEPQAPSNEEAAPDAAPLPAPVPAPPAPSADPNLSACATDEPLPISFDTDPSDRRVDRVLAYLGLLSDAAPMFQTAARVPRAGVLLALPALADSGVLDCARDIYGSIGPAFYGLRTSLLAMLLMALLRIKRPESLKEHAPDDLGRLLGLDRAPEVKTLRRKLTRLAALARATAFGRALAERRVAARGAAFGFLYVDGHVRVYHGKHAIPKAHVARMRLAMSATTDYWVNDPHGEPLFVITAEANAGLVKMMPTILDEVRRLVGEQRRVTIVFDRGGFSPRLFQTMIALGFDVLTYRKGRSRRVPSRLFQPRDATIDGCNVRYVLADRGVRFLGGKLRLRQITRLSDNGHQTPILTSRRDLSDIEIAFRMFERWRQENFFKYLREEYALDALVDHKVEGDDPTREVPNPVWHALTAELRAARNDLAGLSAIYGLEAFTNVERVRRTVRGFKIAHASEARDIRTALKRYTALEKRRAAVPRRVPIQNVVDGKVVKLATERKHLTSLLKMVAYQAESDLVRLVTPHYKRAADEGRTLVQTALASAADIHVDAHELRIALAPLSSAHRTRAIAALCDSLNATSTYFPGTRMRLRFAIAAPHEPQPSAT